MKRSKTKLDAPRITAAEFLATWANVVACLNTLNLEVAGLATKAAPIAQEIGLDLDELRKLAQLLHELAFTANYPIVTGNVAMISTRKGGAK